MPGPYTTLTIVDNWLERENVGLGKVSPEALDEMLKTEGMSDLFAK